MTDPLPYRIALRCYPKHYRRLRSAEILATLAEGDEARGRASLREALALAASGLRERGHGLASPSGIRWLVATAALALTISYLAPDGAWTSRAMDVGFEKPVTIAEGPWMVGRLVVPVVAFLVAIGALAPRPGRRWAVIAGAASVGFVTSIFVFATQPNSIGLPAVIRQDWNEALTVAILAAAGAVIMLLFAKRAGRVHRIRLCGSLLMATGAAASVPAVTRDELGGTYGGTWAGDLGPAFLIAVTGCVLSLAVLALTRSDESDASTSNHS